MKQEMDVGDFTRRDCVATPSSNPMDLGRAWEGQLVDRRGNFSLPWPHSFNIRGAMQNTFSD